MNKNFHLHNCNKKEINKKIDTTGEYLKCNKLASFNKSFSLHFTFSFQKLCCCLCWKPKNNQHKETDRYLPTQNHLINIHVYLIIKNKHNLGHNKNVSKVWSYKEFQKHFEDFKKSQLQISREEDMWSYCEENSERDKSPITAVSFISIAHCTSNYTSYYTPKI